MILFHDPYKNHDTIEGARFRLGFASKAHGSRHHDYKALETQALNPFSKLFFQTTKNRFHVNQEGKNHP